jgi:ribonuclease HII
MDRILNVMKPEEVLRRIRHGIVLGVDEVGRCPWAGPLVVGAVAFNGMPPIGLVDSKILSAATRQQYVHGIKKHAIICRLGWVWPQEIDEMGLTAATSLAIDRALENIVPYDHLLIDGSINYAPDNPRAVTLVKADALVPGVSAASILAKVARDKYMAEQASNYPEYGFERHVGYGTAMHRRAIIEHGITPIHRMSFRPVQQIHNMRAKEGLA